MSGSDFNLNFGRHVRSCRRARALTQDTLAARCDLSVDTIRRLEQGSFSPSLDTLRKLAGGLELRISTLFEAFEFRRTDLAREVVDQILLMGVEGQALVLRLLPLLRELSQGPGHHDD